KRPVRFCREASSSPARPRPGARSARRQRWRFHSIAGQPEKETRTMLITRWLSNRLGLSRRPASRMKTPAARPRFRPMLEGLEQRWVPSTLTVQNNQDSGPGSLRAQIAAAHNGDAINFASSLTGKTITLSSGELYIKHNLTITGPGAANLTISGGNKSHV